MPAKLMTEKQFRKGCEEWRGVCTKCGHTQKGCEPDARGYECNKCKKPAVFGYEWALLEGHIDIK